METLKELFYGTDKDKLNLYSTIRDNCRLRMKVKLPAVATVGDLISKIGLHTNVASEEISVRSLVLSNN